MGARHYLEGDYGTAFEYLTKAAELDNAEAHYQLGCHGGHAKARFQLACYEWINGRFDREVKHLIIAARLGCDYSIENLRTSYVDGLVSKEEFATALRAHQAAVDATKSPLREAAAKAEAAGEIRWM
eukprot:scaffold698_cov195-Skeletonema_marinoi.AAC.2